MLVISDLNLALKGVSVGQAKFDAIMSSGLLKGYLPVARTYKVTPMDQTSLAGILPSSYD